MRNRRWIPAAVLAAAALMSGNVFAESPTEAGGTIQYLNAEKESAAETFRTVDGKRCYYDADGMPVKETLFEVNGECYYAEADGWRYIDDSDETAEDGTSIQGWYYFKSGLAYTAYSTANVQIISDSKPIAIVKIEGEHYAFDTQGRMVTGLVLSERDEPAYTGKYYYFGTDGKMKTGLVNVSDSELTPPADEMYFEPKYSDLTRHGMSVTGEAKGKLYDNGVPVKAERYRYELITISDGRTYVVSETGTLKKSGIAELETGKKMKISYDGENYSWEEVGTAEK